MNAIPASLDFQGVILSVTDHKGRLWLTLNGVARALYGIKGGDETVTSFDEENKRGRAKTGTPFETARSHTLRTFKTHADEFTADETALIDLSTAGGLQKVRVFSIRGCRLMGMVSRAPMAKPFRKWALDQFDVLDALAFPTAEAQPLLPGFRPEQTRIAHRGSLTTEQQDAIKTLVKSRAPRALPTDKQGHACRTMWSALCAKFNVKTYKDVPSEHFTDVLSLIARLPFHNKPALPPTPNQTTPPLPPSIQEAGR